MKYAGLNSAHIHCIQFHSIIISAKKMNWYQPLVNWFNQKAPKNLWALNQGNFSFLVMTQSHGIVFQFIWCVIQLRHGGFYSLITKIPDEAWGLFFLWPRNIRRAGVDKELFMIFAYFIVLIISYSIINIDWRAGWLQQLYYRQPRPT